MDSVKRETAGKDLGSKFTSLVQRIFIQFLDISFPKALESALTCHLKESPLLLEDSLLREKADPLYTRTHVCTHRARAHACTHTLCVQLPDKLWPSVQCCVN